MQLNISNLDERKKFANWVKSFIRTPPWERESLIKPGGIPFVYKDVEEVLNYKEDELEDYIKILRDLLDIDLKYTTSNIALFTPIITLRLIYMILFVMVHKAHPTKFSPSCNSGFGVGIDWESTLVLMSD